MRSGTICCPPAPHSLVYTHSLAREIGVRVRGLARGDVLVPEVDCRVELGFEVGQEGRDVCLTDLDGAGTGLGGDPEAGVDVARTIRALIDPLEGPANHLGRGSLTAVDHLLAKLAHQGVALLGSDRDHDVALVVGRAVVLDHARDGDLDGRGAVLDLDAGAGGAEQIDPREGGGSDADGKAGLGHGMLRGRGLGFSDTHSLPLVFSFYSRVNLLPPKGECVPTLVGTPSALCKDRARMKMQFFYTQAQVVLPRLLAEDLHVGPIESG